VSRCPDSTVRIIRGADGITRAMDYHTGRPIDAWPSAPATDRVKRPSRVGAVAAWLFVFAALSLVGLAMLVVGWHVWLAVTRIAP